MSETELPKSVLWAKAGQHKVQFDPLDPLA